MTTLKSQVLHIGTTPLYLRSCGTTVSRLPLVSKRRRWPLSRGHGTITPHTCIHTRIYLILALASIT
jgi:hypothetical protein